MKTIVFAIVTSLLCSCNSTKTSVQNYYYVEPFKEQEVRLYLNFDSTFKLQDTKGCNQFEFTGRYRRGNDSVFNYLVFDWVKFQSELSNSTSSNIFSIKNGDTAWVLNEERLLIHKQNFRISYNSKINLQEIRYKKLKEYYIDFLGREDFIKIFGNGKSMKYAKKRLLDCSLPDIKIK